MATVSSLVPYTIVKSTLDNFQSTVEGMVEKVPKEAPNEATCLLIEGILQAKLLVAQTTRAYATGKDVTIEASSAAGQIFKRINEFLTDLEQRTTENLSSLSERTESLLRILPYSETQLYLIGCTSCFFIPDPEQVGATTPITFKGCFPYSTSYSFTATLTFGKIRYTFSRASNTEIEFRVNPFDIFRQNLVPITLAASDNPIQNQYIDELTPTTLGAESPILIHEGNLEISFRPSLQQVWSAVVTFPADFVEIPEYAGELVAYYHLDHDLLDKRPVMKEELYFSAKKGEGTVRKTHLIVPEYGWELATQETDRPSLEVMGTVGSSKAWFQTTPQLTALHIELYATKSDASALLNVHATEQRLFESGKPFAEAPIRVEWDKLITLETPTKTAELVEVRFDSTIGGQRKYLSPFISDEFLEFTQGANGSWDVVAVPAKNPAVEPAV